MPQVAVTLVGKEELLRRLAALARRHVYEAAEVALLVATKPMLDTAFAMAPVETFNLKKSMGRKLVRQTPRRRVWCLTGPRRAKAFMRGGYYDPAVRQFATRYAHLVEFGTHGGAHAGNPRPAQPFLRPAFDTNWRNAVTLFANAFLYELEQRAPAP